MEVAFEAKAEAEGAGLGLNSLSWVALLQACSEAGQVRWGPYGGSGLMYRSLLGSLGRRAVCDLELSSLISA